MLITDEFTWDFPTFESYVEGMCSQVAAYPSNVIPFQATISPLTILTLFATWKVGKTAFPQRAAADFVPTFPLPSKPTPTQWNPDNLATYLYTSGSSGLPKIACNTLQNHILSARGSMPLTPQNIWALTLPLYHVGGLAILFRCYLAKASILLSQNFSRATHISLIPTQLYRHLRDQIPLPATILFGGAPLPVLPSHLNILPTYGMTEMSSQIVMNHKLHPHAEMHIAPDNEVWVRGGTLFQGYLGQSSPLNSDGWFPTGDLARWENNQFHVIGRKDNLFISGGENIQPEEIEAAIRTHCNIFDAIVIPIPNEEFGARPAVFLHDPSLLPLLQAQLTGILPKFKIPTRAFLLPSNTSLKPNRKALRALLL